MSRGLSSAHQTAAAQRHRINVPCLEIEFLSGTLRLAAGPYQIIDSSGTYIATGALMRASAVKEESTGLQGMECAMSGLDPAIIAIATASGAAEYRGRIIRVRKARLNADTQQSIGNTTIEWVGRMRNMIISEANDRCEVQITAEHYELELTRPAPRRWNDADQQRDFPGDLSCQYAATMVEKFLPFPAKEALQK